MISQLAQELDKKLKEITPSESYYLENIGVLSEKYFSFKKVFINNKEVYFFEMSELKGKSFKITKNSRFTKVPEHCHSNLYMSYIYSGSCNLTVNGETITMNENDVCFIDKNAIRSKDYLSENDIVINIHLSHSFISENLLKRINQFNLFSNFILSVLSGENNHNNYIFFRSGNSEKLRGLFINLISECYNHNEFSNEVISSYLSLIMIELIKLYKENSEPHKIYITKKTSYDIINIIEHIENNYKDCTLRSLADEFNYTPKYLSQMIKTKTGLNFKEIQNIQRMKAAALLLETTGDSILEISQDVGMHNEYFFYTKFKEHYGITPKQYRVRKSFNNLVEHSLL